MKDDGSVRADAVDLDIEGTRLRIVCDDPEGCERLRAELAEHLVDEPAPLGFVIQAPTPEQRFHLLLDRAGYVLARVGSTAEALTVLARHLTGALPPPPGTVRVRGRLFRRGDDELVLAAFPLFTREAVVERRLARLDARVIDRMVIDLHPDATIGMVASPWDGLGAGDEVVGHAPVPTGRHPVGALLLAMVGDELPPRSQLVSLLSAETQPCAPHDARLALVDRLVSGRVVAVGVSDSAETYAALG